jgi:dihydroxyacetone kinase DhaKLM complex PTS-EIIA-like component DhaM
MGYIGGTQEFLKQHVGHKVSISVLSTIDNKFIGTIEETPSGYVAGCDEKKDAEWVQDTGIYVYCQECKVEEEQVNSTDVDYESFAD